MVDSTSVRPVAWRWSRRIGRSLLAGISLLLLVYGGVQLSLAALVPILPLSSPLPLGEAVSVLESIPPVHLVGSFTVDLVLNPESLSAVGISVGLGVVSAFGMGFAVPISSYPQRATSNQENTLSDALPFHDPVVVAHEQDHSEIARGAMEFLKLAVMCVILWGALTQFLFPELADMESLSLWSLKIFAPALLLLAGLAGVLAIVNAVWYARERWQVRQTAGGESR